MLLRWLHTGPLTISLALGLSSHSASAQAIGECSLTDVEYDIAANLRITGTVMGAGNGTHRVGPGRVLIRLGSGKGQTSAELLSYRLRERFDVESTVLFWTTRVTTDIEVTAPNPPRDAIAVGALRGRTLLWGGKAEGFKSDGTLVCSGSMCGRYGAPPAGASVVHLGPTTIELQPFEFGVDMKTFTTAYALVSESELPKQRTFVSMAGREMRRTCVTRERSDAPGHATPGS